MKEKWQWGLLTVWMLLALAVLASAESADPCFPEEWHVRQAAEQRTSKRWPPARIRQLETERGQLLERISKLPLHQPKPLIDRLGYHSLPGHSGFKGTPTPHVIIADFVFQPILGSIAMAPAFNPMDPRGGAYAFPKRFKIDLQEGAGGSAEDQDALGWIEVVNWLDEDFPDPGPYPVFFAGINKSVRKVRLTVPRIMSESGAGFFALGELYLFKDMEGRTADNMATWGASGVSFEVSDSLAMPPLWDAEYLSDGVVGLGAPLSEEKVAAGDLLVTFEDGEPSDDPVRMVLDLGATQRVGRIQIWPAEAPLGMAVPLYGFPGKLRVELSVDPSFAAAKTVGIDHPRARMHRDHLLNVICEAYEARYIRITFENLDEYEGKRILGIGEISASEHGNVLSVGCRVAAEGIPEEQLDQLTRLVDGCSRHRRILPEQEWIVGLAKRRPLDRRLAMVEWELSSAREAWRVFQFRLSVWGGVALLFVMLIGWQLLKRQRRLALNRLKQRITRDLHDEVGSSLGSISLTSEQLENMAVDEEMKEELGGLSLTAREACVSLREVVWMTDRDIIRLPALIDKLVERADRVLRGVEVTVEISPSCPDTEVSLTFKRHLVMFFKEAVHNCARHANAKRVCVAVVADDRFLHVSVRDDGCGFDPSQEMGGWGLDSMQKRAEELGGELELRSCPGEGATITLKAPLAALSRDPSSAYKTSN